MVESFYFCLFARNTRNTVGENGNASSGRKIRIEKTYRHAAEQTVRRKEKNKRDRLFFFFLSIHLFSYNLHL
jgi:hypothetical protein